MLTAESESETFQSSIDNWVLKACRNDCTDFKALVHSLPGVFPTEAIKSLQRLERVQEITSEVAQKLISSARNRSLQGDLPTGSRLPVAHPLDYDWRFAPQSIDRLVKMCDATFGTIVCLGTPTLFERFIRSNRSCTFIDSSLATIQHFKTTRFASIINCDCLCDPVPKVAGDVIILDPPWYEDYSKAFLWVAASICTLYGRLFVSVPPLGTRASVSSERGRIIGFAGQLGLAVESIDEDILPYDTPHFEANTFRRLGIHCSLGSWRHGSLVTFRKLFHNRVERPIVEKQPKWKEISLYDTRIRFRSVDSAKSSDPRLVPITQGHVLKSVSRQDPQRARVDVWTSGNRVFRCNSPNELFEVGATASRWIGTIENRCSQFESIGARQVALSQLLCIARREMEERRSLNICYEAQNR